MKLIIRKIFSRNIAWLLDLRSCLLDTLLNIKKMLIGSYLQWFCLFWSPNVFILLICFFIRKFQIPVLNIRIIIIKCMLKLLPTCVCIKLYLLKYFMHLLKLLELCRLFLLQNGYTDAIWFWYLESCIFLKEFFQDGLKLFILLIIKVPNTKFTHGFKSFHQLPFWCVEFYRNLY